MVKSKDDISRMMAKSRRWSDSDSDAEYRAEQ